MLRALFAVLIMILSPLSYGECSDLAEKLSAELGYVIKTGERAGSTSARFLDCKVWPADSTKMIIALAIVQKGIDAVSATGDDGKDGLYDLDVLIVSTSTGKLVHRVFQKGALYSDADYLSGVTIDTGRYDLAKGVRAFGVRAFNSHSGGVSSEAVTLDLYAIQNGRLTPIMDRITVRHSVANSAGYDCYDVKEKERTISVGNKSNFGYAELHVNEKQENTEVTYQANSCKEVAKKINRHYVIRYDGTRYRLPAALKEGVLIFAHLTRRSTVTRKRASHLCVGQRERQQWVVYGQSNHKSQWPLTLHR